MNLTDDQIAAAEAVGCSFQPVPPAQLARYAMQRKVFRIGDKSVLVTRGGGLYETAATLQGLLALGRERIEAGRAQVAVEKPAMPPAALPQWQSTDPDLMAARPVRPIAKQRSERRAGAARSIKPAAGRDQEVMPPHEAPRSDAQVSRPRSAPAARRSRGWHEPRWVTAGAERRGRAGVHWSTRLR